MAVIECSRRLSAPLRWSSLVLGCCAIAACVAGPRVDRAIAYRGDLEIFLEPADSQGICAVTVGLRNVSGVRQGEARIRFDWFDASGLILGDQYLRMDPTDINRYDAKNLVLPAKCSTVERARIRSAEWRLGWDMTSDRIVPIANADGMDVAFRWDESLQLFVGKVVAR